MLERFQSPRSGKFVSNEYYDGYGSQEWEGFQSPRSGKFVSNSIERPIYGEGNTVSIP